MTKQVEELIAKIGKLAIAEADDALWHAFYAGVIWKRAEDSEAAQTSYEGYEEYLNGD